MKNINIRLPLFILTAMLIGGCDEEKNNAIPTIISYSGITTINEDTSLSLDINDFIVEDSDSAFPDDFQLIILEGENYSHNDLEIIPSQDFNGTIQVPIQVKDQYDVSPTFHLTISISPVFDPPIITGYYIRDITGTGFGMIGSPNTFLSDNPSALNATRISIYPNPCKFLFYVDGEKSSKCWIIPATFSENDNQEYSEEEITVSILNEESIFQTDLGSKYTEIDVSSFAKGYYRVYVQAGDLLLYDNLAIVE